MLTLARLAAKHGDTQFLEDVRNRARPLPVMYNTFGDIDATFGELGWKNPIFSGRVVPKTPNTS
jgi:hypothetical protein